MWKISMTQKEKTCSQEIEAKWVSKSAIKICFWLGFDTKKENGIYRESVGEWESLMPKEYYIISFGKELIQNSQSQPLDLIKF
jgi:hypothetical protein